MKTFTFLLLLCCPAVAGFAQSISVTFTGTGASKHVDQVKATNLTTNESVTFPGYGTLKLYFNNPLMGVPSLPEESAGSFAYPNPCNGKTTVIMNVSKPQKVSVTVHSESGQLVAQMTEVVGSGNHEFAVTLAHAGIYFVRLASEDGTASCKLISNGASGTDYQVQYQGIQAFNAQTGNSSSSIPAKVNLSESGLKAARPTFNLSLAPGDVILYQCTSGDYQTFITEAPAISKNYEVEFAACTDLSGRNYPVVKIGNQTWMAQNLAFLPQVNPSYEGTEYTKAYYVYGYDGNRVSEARATENYSLYGVLYNWQAAQTACPEGWRLPTDEEWKKLEMELGQSVADADCCGWRCSGCVGRQLKEGGNNHWESTAYIVSNSSGFTGLPGGFRMIPYPSNGSGTDLSNLKSVQNGAFENLSHCGNFWTSTQYNSTNAYSRKLGCMDHGVYRSPFNKGYGFSVRCVKN